ncbi:MAG: hypothetical protein HGA19_15555, partial [Oscillochloris sp.]|nr:hypothetical protein [Oscillochloris sp.]
PEALVAACLRLTLLRAWTLVWSYQPAALEQLLESIDGAVPAAMAEILVLRAFVASSRNDWPAAQQLSRQALHAASAEPLLHGFIYAGMGDLAWVTGDTLEAIECHRCALECACRSGSLIQLADATHSLAQFEILQGQLSAAEATCAYGAAQLTQHGAATEPFGELLALSQATILYERNELAAARTAVEQSLPLASRCGLCAYESFIHVELARISAAQGDTLTARQELLAGLQGTQRIVAQSGNRTPIWVAILRLREVEIGLSLGDLPIAARWAIQHWTPPDPQARMDLLLRQYALAQVLVACSDQPALLDRLCTQTGTPLIKLAAQLIASCEQRFSTMGLGTLLVEIHTLSAVLHAYDGRQPQALSALLRAIGLAMPEGIVRPFISRGAPMQRLLVAALTQWEAIPEQHEQHHYASHLLAVFPPHFVTCVLKRSCTPDPVGPQYPDRIAEPLSGREREVMRLLANGLSHREIATALTIAPDTARTHIKNIYGKLQVQNRVQALVRARNLNLV